MPMKHADFSHVRTWIFDLDNTLYPPEARLFDQIEHRMENWIIARLGVSQDRAKTLRSSYWQEHGTTLAGLMAEHDIDPWDFLNDVHDVTTDHLKAAPDLAAHITALPGRRIVYTNGDAPYARRVLAARGLSDVFDAVYGIEHANWRPKPERDAFQTIFAADGLDPTCAAMFEDDHRNLQAPHEMGLRTVHVAPAAHNAIHIHHHTDDLTGFLSHLVT